MDTEQLKINKRLFQRLDELYDELELIEHGLPGFKSGAALMEEAHYPTEEITTFTNTLTTFKDYISGLAGDVEEKLDEEEGS